MYKTIIKNREAVGKKLVKCLESLASDLESTAAALDKEMKASRAESERFKSWPINTLGEVQGRGSEIDTLCARWGALTEMLNLLQDEEVEK